MQVDAFIHRLGGADEKASPAPSVDRYMEAMEMPALIYWLYLM